MKKSVLFLMSFFLFCQLAQADFSALLQKAGLSTKSTLNDSKIGQGIKEALKVGIDKTVEKTSRKDGYFADPQIKIPVPERLKMMDSLLRKTGFGSKMDEMVLSMNRAAETAAPHAKNIFVESIAAMSVEDARQIWKGSDTAATDFFRAKSSPELQKIYKPLVTQSMSQYQVTQKYQALILKYNALPLAQKFKAPEIEQYVTEKALDGLFKVLGQQEKLIRRDPAARVTSLLKEVFGASKEGTV